VPSIAATVAHCRGLLRNDQAELAHAVELFAASLRPLAHASALEDLALALIDGGERSNAVDRLDESQGLYVRAGATWDAGRVRNRMRRLGIRRRIVNPAPPANGWAGLTPSELRPQLAGPRTSSPHPWGVRMCDGPSDAGDRPS
jgi:hypothetical protein